MSFRRETLDQIGLLDEDFFLGTEDLELCIRLRATGYRLLVAHGVFVRHASHKSFESEPGDKTQAILDESDRVKARKLEAMFPNGVPSSEQP